MKISGIREVMGEPKSTSRKLRVKVKGTWLEKMTSVEDAKDNILQYRKGVQFDWNATGKENVGMNEEIITSDRGRERHP